MSSEIHTEETPLRCRKEYPINQKHNPKTLFLRQLQQQNKPIKRICGKIFSLDESRITDVKLKNETHDEKKDDLNNCPCRNSRKRYFLLVSAKNKDGSCHGKSRSRI